MFTVIDLVCGSRSSISALLHVVAKINSFLRRIPPQWTLESESKSGEIWRLNVLVKSEWSGLSQDFREMRFENAIKKAMLDYDFDVLGWWMLHYPLPEHYGDPRVKVFKLAVDSVPSYAHVVESKRPASDIENNLSESWWMHTNRSEKFSTRAHHVALERGNTGLAQLLYDNNPRGYFEEPTSFHLYYHESQVKWIASNYEWMNVENRTEWIKKCVENGFTSILFENNYRDEGEAMTIAARKGDLNLVISLHNRKAQAKIDAMDAAAANGHLRVVQWLHYNRSEGCTTEAMDGAASRNHIDVVQWLHENRKEGWTTQAMDISAKVGYNNMVEWLHRNRTEGCTTLMMDEAASSGHIDMVEWLHTHRSEGCTTKAMDGAVERWCNDFCVKASYEDFEFELVEWLHENRTEGPSSDALGFAVKWGKLHIIKWLLEHYPKCLSPKVLAVAIESRRHSIFEWLIYNHSQGREDMDAAAKCGDLAMVKWLHTNRSDGCSTKAMGSAAKNGHLDVVKFLHENRSEGCTTAAMDMAARYEHEDIVQYLHDHRREDYTTNMMDTAASHRNWRLVKWIGNNRSEGGTTKSIKSACYCGNFEMLKFLTPRCKIYCDLRTLEVIYEKNRFSILEWLLKHYHDVNHVVVNNWFINI